ncbi:MAG: hypothetical protein EBX52_13980, partial [Proteobacteria bacterium]|nr:hypothetical protein [Pseudomonadota bacterium]
MTFTFLLDPALFPKKAYAWKDYDNSVCKQIDADKESGDPQRSPPQDALNECVNAKLARKVETAAKIKTVIFGAGAIACFAMAIWSFLGSDSICAAIGIALAATDMIMSQVFQHDAESTVGKVTSFVSMGQGMGIAAAGKLASGIFKKGAIKVGTKSSAKAGCIISGIVLTLMTAMAIWDWIESKNLGSKHLQNAKEMKDAYDARNRVNTNYGGTTGNTGNPGAAPGSSGTTDGGSSGDPCEGKTGNDYLKCLGQEAHDPQLSAMADNPDLDNLLTPLLGQHPAEFAKGYSGEPSLDGVRDYAAKALGISDGAKGILEKIQKAVMEDLGDK